MLARLRSETSGWYKLFMTYLVASPEDADVRMLDAAMDGLGTASYFLGARRGGAAPLARVEAGRLPQRALR